MSFDKIIEILIKEAQARGEFDGLAGKGKPIDLTEYFNAPEEARVAQALLKDAGMVPVEIDLLQEIVALKETLKFAKNEAESIVIRKKLTDKELQFNLLIERRRRK
jgi:hypothetical protein